MLKKLLPALCTSVVICFLINCPGNAMEQENRENTPTRYIQKVFVKVEEGIIENTLNMYDTKFYNTFSSAEEADSNLKKSGKFDVFIKEAKNLAKNNNMDSFTGIRLIHRHTTLDENEAMLEQHELFNWEEALVTRPVKYMKELQPASWIYHDGKFKVFEYSSDDMVKYYFNKINYNTTFLSDFAQTLEKFALQNILALAITDRDLYHSLREDSNLIEKSYEKPSFASVVTAEDKTKLDYNGAIITGWKFSSPREDICEPVVYCQEARWGHTYPSYHRVLKE